VLITSGLKENEKVLLSVPTGMDADKVNLLKELNGLRSKKNEAAQAATQISPAKQIAEKTKPANK
jgi:ribosomal protein L32E